MCTFGIVVYNPFFVIGNNFLQKLLFTLSDKQRNACVEMAGNAVFGEFMRYPLFELLYFSHLMQSSGNCCSINREFLCQWRISFNNPCKSLASNFCDVPGRWLTSKLSALNRRNHITSLQVSWNTTFSRTEQIDSYVLTVFFVLLKLPYNLPNIFHRLSCSLIIWGYINHNKWLLTSMPNSSKMQNNKNLFKI